GSCGNTDCAGGRCDSRIGCGGAGGRVSTGVPRVARSRDLAVLAAGGHPVGIYNRPCGCEACVMDRDRSLGGTCSCLPTSIARSILVLDGTVVAGSQFFRLTRGGFGGGPE